MNKETKIGEVVFILKEFGVNKSIDELYIIASEIVKSIYPPRKTVNRNEKQG